MADGGNGNRAWPLVGILFAAWVIAFVDRQVVLLLLPEIKRSLALSDTRASIVAGLAFALCFSLAGLPLGWLVDRARRRRLLVVAIVGWSLATIFCGLFPSYPALFAGRLAVGVFQAVLAPASFSIVADLFAPAQRGRPIAILMAAATVGAALANLLGGLVLALAGRLAETFPIIAGWAPWQTTLVVLGLPGLVLAFAVGAMREPPRRAAGAVNGPSFRLLPYVVAERRLFAPLLTAYALHFTLGYGFAVWFPTMLVRAAHTTPAQAGLAMGGLLLASAFLSATAGGWLSDRLARRDAVAGHLGLARLMLVCQGLVAPLLLFWANVPVLLAAIGLFTTLNIVGTSAIYTSLPDLVPGAGRGRIVAVEQLLSSLVGLGLGPLAIALVGDYVLRDEGRLGLAMLIVGAVAAALGALLVTSAIPSARDVRKARRVGLAGQA